jgi:hypothetical protein
VTPGEIDQAQAELRRPSKLSGERGFCSTPRRSTMPRAASTTRRSTQRGPALLIRGLSAKTHSGQISVFAQTYGPAPFLGRLFDLRARADHELGETLLTPEAIEEHPR